ncbi:MAG: hypothetical protein ACFFD1_04590 [Candidatus Thorarchaeota archaeon]
MDIIIFVIILPGAIAIAYIILDTCKTIIIMMGKRDVSSQEKVNYSVSSLENNYKEVTNL